MIFNAKIIPVILCFTIKTFDVLPLPSYFIIKKSVGDKRIYSIG